MSEKFGHEKIEEVSVMEALSNVVEEYLPEDAEWLMEFDEDELIGAVYGLLIEQGLDADEILEQFGVTG